MADMNMDEATAQARRIVEQAMKAAHPQAEGRQLQLETAAYALAQSERHARSERFGAEHPLTVAYRDVAEVAAMQTFGHTQDLIDASLARDAASRAPVVMKVAEAQGLPTVDVPVSGMDAADARSLPSGTIYDKTVPSFADLMTVEEFRDAVSCGALTDYDGSAHAVRDGMECADEMDLRGIPADATHVAWYNK